MLALGGGCSRQAAEGDCRKGCDHAAPMRVAAARKAAQMTLHEMEEMAEAAEKTAKTDLARLRIELAAGSAPFDEQPFRARKATPADIKMARDRHEWEAQQLRTQREAGIKAAEETIVSEPKRNAEAKQKAEADLAKTTAEAHATCVERCVKRPRQHVECLLRAQAVEDVDLCEAG